MKITHALITVVSLMVAACSGGGRSEASGIKRGADGLLIVPPLTMARDPIPDPSPAGLGPEPKRYIIWWERRRLIWEDGDFNFVVHPTQVFLRTSSKEPSSKTDVVFWVRDITPEQYRAISESLDRQENSDFVSVSERTHEGYTLFLFKSAEEIQPFTNSTDARTYRQLFTDIMNRNLERVVKELNRDLPPDVEPLFSQASIVTDERQLKILKDPGTTRVPASN